MSHADRRAVAGLNRTIPALPVRDVQAAVAYYRDRFGFDAPHETDDFAVLVRDDAVLHLWGATDDDWRAREDLDRQPICSGAESFLAGTASCRIEVSDVDALFSELKSAGVLHDVSRGGVTATDFGTREFATLDSDGNLLTFFH
jgi:catechol 2,3-dioxygenase-like lactoylglutathione lyase family enzyme